MKKAFGKHEGPIAGKDDSLEKDLFVHKVKKTVEDSIEPGKDYLGISKSSPEELAVSKKFEKGIKPLKEKLEKLKLRFEQESNLRATYSQQYEDINSQVERIKNSTFNNENENEYAVLFIENYNLRLDNILGILNERDASTERLKKEIKLMNDEIDEGSSTNTLGPPPDLQ